MRTRNTPDTRLARSAAAVGPTPRRPRRSLFPPRYQDAWAVLLLTLLSLVVEWPLVTSGTMLGQDTATFFYPMYSYLGQQLRAGAIPAWNPYQFSGAPFAGDPQSGWMYLPAMLLFTLLPFELAVKGALASQPLMAGLFTYALARVLRLDRPASVIAALGLAYGGVMAEKHICCFAYSQAITWLPLAILGVELAVRAKPWRLRAVWWLVSGLALSQALAGWFGQGAYYVFLAAGGYLAYRTLLWPPEGQRSVVRRVAGTLFHGAATLVSAFAFSAAGLLPRLEFNRLSNLAGGYGTAERTAGFAMGWRARDWIALLDHSDVRYAGAAVVTLAVIAPFLVRSRHAVPYFLALVVAALVLSVPQPTPLQWVLYKLLPMFERLHPHWPDRIRIVLYLGTGLLAGATWCWAGRRGRRSALLALLPVTGVLVLRLVGLKVEWSSVGIVALAALLFAAASLLPRYKPALSALMVLVVFLDLASAQQMVVAHQMKTTVPLSLRKMSVTAYYAPHPAGQFLLDRSRSEMFRYFGLNGLYLPDPNLPYWAQPYEQDLLLNNRGTLLGLQSIEGYDPQHIKRYDDVVTQINGREQPYWFADIFPNGLTSPLLDLLNVRYFVVAASAVRQSEFSDVLTAFPLVFSDGVVQVRERPSALPRAWIVHSARQMLPDEILPALASRAVDPRTTALLEEPPPPMESPAGPGSDSVQQLEYAQDRITARTTTTAPGMLVLSEVYYPAWKAYVDGRPAKVYVTDHALRGVAVPAGSHTVELRYESRALRFGLLISAAAYGALAVLGGLLLLRRLKRDGGAPGRPS